MTYQVGTNTIYTKCVEVFDGIQTVIENTYTLSQPLTSAEHPSKGSTVFHVPASTTVTCQYNYNGPDGSEQANEIIWGKVSSVSAVKYDGEFTTIDLNYTGSLTVQGGSVYAIANENEGGGFVDFPAVGFIGD